MNKNTKWRRAVALRNFRVNKQGSTEFEVPVMRPGGYVMTKQTIHIGFVTPPPSTRRKMQVVVSPTGNKGELDVLVAEADSLLGKPKFQAPPREPRPLRPAKEAKPLGKIGL